MVRVFHELTVLLVAEVCPRDPRGAEQRWTSGVKALRLPWFLPSLSFRVTSLAIAPRAVEARCSCRSRVACPPGSGSGWGTSAGARPNRRTAPAPGAA